MKLTNRQKWLRTIVWLKRTFPPQKPAFVKTCKTDKDLLGFAQLTGTYFKVEIQRNLNFQIKMEVLIHEWAHVISWFGAGHEEDHPDDWGLAFAKIYREFLEWDYGRAGTLEDSNVL